jgi:hypothetical protein
LGTTQVIFDGVFEVPKSLFKKNVSGILEQELIYIYGSSVGFGRVVPCLEF